MKTYLGQLDGISATAQELCVLWHQHSAGIVRRGVEQRLGGASCGRGAQGAGELDGGGSDTRHCACGWLMEEKEVKLRDAESWERAWVVCRWARQMQDGENASCCDKSGDEIKCKNRADGLLLFTMR